MCSCLFAREHNISGDEKSSDHAKPRQNRGVQFSYYKHQSLPGATGTIFRGKQRSRWLCRVTQTKSNPNFCYWRQGLRCSFGSLLTDSSFWENVCTAHHYSNESFCTEETGYRRKILIPQLYTTQRRECHSVRCQPETSGFSITCQFGTHLKEALRDRLVCGLRSKETQKKLLTEEHTFDAALKVALGAEAAEKYVAAFSQESSVSVNKVDSGNHQSFPPTQGHKGSRNRGKFNSSGSNIKDPSECLSCGKTGHPSSQCTYRNYTSFSR